MDLDDIYNDLDNFQVEEVKNAELLALETKYQESLTTIDQLKAENADLQKKVKTMHVNFQNLLDTAKAEIRRKDKQIAELRMEKDDLCFRRKQPKPARPSADAGIVHAKQRGNSNLEATTMSAYNDANPTVGTEQQGHSAWVPATTTQQPFEVVPRTAATIEPAERSSRSRADERIQRTREHHADGEKHSSCDSRGRRERSSSRHSRSDALERKRGRYESESSGSTYEKSEREHRGREEERHRDLRKDSRDSHRETIRPRRKSQEKHRNVYEERHSRHSSNDKRESSKYKTKSDRDNERGKSAHDRKDTVRLTSKEAEMQALEADFTQIANSTHHKREKHMSKNDDQQDTARQEQHNQKRHERDKVKQHNEHKMEDHLRRKSDDTSGEIAKVNPRIDELQQHGNCSTKVAPHVNSNNENGVREIPAIENNAEHVAGTENTAKVALPKMDENSNVTRALQQLNTPTKAALYDSLFGETPSSVESVSSNLLNNVMSLLQSGGGSNDSNSTALSVCTDNADAQAQVQNDFAGAKPLVEQYFVENAADSGVKLLNAAAADISYLSDIAREYIPGLGDSPLCKRTSMNRGVFGFLMKHNEVIEIEDDINIDVTDEEHNDKASVVAIESGNESRKSVHDDSNGKADIVILEDIQLPHIFKLEERETELLRIKTAAKGEEQKEEEFELKVANGDIEDQQVKNDEKNVPISLREVGSQQPASLHEDNINTLNEGESLKPTNHDRDAISLFNEIVSSSETLKEKDKSASEAEIVGGANKECVESEADISTKSKGIADKQSEASSFGPNEIAVTVRKLENSRTIEMPTLDAESKTVSVGKEESTKANFEDAENFATADQISERSAEAAVTPDNNKQIEVMVGDAEKMKVNVSDLAASRTHETLLSAKVEHALHTKNCKDEATAQLKPPSFDNNSASLGFEGAEAMTVSVELPRKDVDRKTAELETETFAQCGNVNELKSINNFTTDNGNLENEKHLDSPNNVDDCYGNKEEELAGRSEMEKKEESMSQAKSKEEAGTFSNLPVAHSAHKSDKHLNIKSTECKTTEEAINCVEAVVDRKSTLDRVAKETQSQVKVKTNEGKDMQQIVDRTLEMAVTKNATQSAISANVKEYNSKNDNGLKTLLAAAQLNGNAKQSPPATEAEIADTLIKLKNSTPNEANVVKAPENSTEKQKSSTAGTHVSKVAQKQVDKEANNCEKEVEHVQDTYPRNGDAEVEDAVSYIVHSVSCQATSGARSSLESVENNMKLIETPKLNETTQVKSKLKPTKRSIQKPAAKLEQKMEAQQIWKPAEGLGRRKKKVTPALVQRKGKQLDAQKAPNAGKKVGRSLVVDKKNSKFDSKLGIEIIDLEKLDNDEIKSVKADNLKMVQGLNTLKESEMEAEKAATVIQQHTEPLLDHSEKTPVVLPALNCLLIGNNTGLQAINKFKIPKLATKKDEQIKVPSVAADKQVKNSPNCAKRQMPKVKAHNKAEHAKANILKSAAGAQQCAETTQIPSEFLEMPKKLEQSATEVEKQLKDAHNACEEWELKNARAMNETADPSEVTNSLPESTIEFLEEQKAMLKRKLSECCLDESSDEELCPPKAAWRPLKRRRRKMRVLDTDDEFVVESCTQALTVLKPLVADSRQALPEMPKDSEKAAQRETKTADKLEAEALTITDTNTSSLMQSPTVQLPSRMADIQVNSENSAKKETNAEAAELAAELKEKTTSQTERNLNASLSSDSCNPPAFMSPLFTANTSQDERYREIDSRLQSMFASPPRSALNFTSKTPITCSPLAPDFNVSETFVGNESVQSITPAELTVDETNRLEQSGSKLEANSTLDDSTASTGTKNISLGLSDYRFEKVSDNVVNLFITRKRRGKRPRAQLEHNLATTTAS